MAGADMLRGPIGAALHSVAPRPRISSHCGGTAAAGGRRERNRVALKGDLLRGRRDLADEDRAHSLGLVLKDAGRSGKTQLLKPKPLRWNYTRFGRSDAPLTSNPRN